MVIYTGLTAYEVYLTREQLKEALSQQRAWIRVSIQPTGNLEFGKTGGFLFTDILATNVGNLPAQGVFADAHLQVIDVGDGKVEIVPEAPDCHEGRFAPVGATIFPGETRKLLPIPLSLSSSDIARLHNRPLGVIANVCVTYAASPTRLAHTLATFNIGRAHPQWGPHLFIDLHNDLILKKDLAIDQQPAGNDAD